MNIAKARNRIIIKKTRISSSKLMLENMSCVGALASTGDSFDEPGNGTRPSKLVL